jgi:putative ABC transport system permease protein
MPVTWNARPIVSALLRNRTGAVLVALQIALALAVLVNAVYVVKQRVEKVGRDSGLDDANTFVVSSSGFSRDYDHVATIREDLEYLRGLPGVVAATPASWIPLSGGGSSTGLLRTPDQRSTESISAAYLEVDEGAVEALDVELVAGRNFATEEIRPPIVGSEFPAQVIVTSAFAQSMFGTTNVVGRPVYDGQQDVATIIGVIDKLQAAWVSWDKLEHVVLFPRLPAAPGNYYIVRAAPGARDALMRTVEEKLSTSNPGRVIEWVRPFEMFRKCSYRADRNMAIFLVTVTTMLLAIAALGIFGLATFNVGTRTRQIGTRRAVGARRGDIVRYFLVENWMITTAGVVAGCGLALGVGYALSVSYELPRLDLYYLVGGVLVVWMLGQFAAWQPARKAARISPAVATRNV